MSGDAGAVHVDDGGNPPAMATKWAPLATPGGVSRGPPSVVAPASDGH